MNLNQLKHLIREGVAELLSEKAKKNLIFVSDKPDPLHHLQGSKKFGGSKNKKKDNEKLKKDIVDTGREECECEEDDVSDKVKVFHEENEEDQPEALTDFKFSTDVKKKSQKAELKKEGYHRRSLLEGGWFGIGDSVAPDDDNGQRSMDPYNMKKLRGHYTGKKYETNAVSGNVFYDASDIKLCWGSNSFKEKDTLSINTIIDLLNELSDVLDDCDAIYVTITPYSVQQAKKIYIRNPKDVDLFVICLGVAERKWDLWGEIDLNQEKGNDMMLLYQKYGMPDSRLGWAGFWNWLLKSVMKVQTMDVRLFIRGNTSGDMINCYSTRGLKEDIKNAIDKFDKFQSKGIPKSDENAKLKFLLKMLDKNMWHASGGGPGSELTDEQRANIKAEIKKMRGENESWTSWGKRKLGLNDDEGEDI